MTPITRSEQFLASAAGDDTGQLPEPVTRLETYLQKVCDRLDTIENQSDEQFQTAVDNYLDENSIVFNTSAEITEVLNG
jgi:hypothetical protein